MKKVEKVEVKPVEKKEPAEKKEKKPKEKKAKTLTQSQYGIYDSEQKTLTIRVLASEKLVQKDFETLTTTGAYDKETKQAKIANKRSRLLAFIFHSEVDITKHEWTYSKGWLTVNGISKNPNAETVANRKDVPVRKTAPRKK